MSMRRTDTDKWNDPWFMRLSKESKYLFMYLSDACDGCGFIERDDWRFSRDTGMSEKEVQGAYKELLAPFKGACKVVLRGLQGASDGIEEDNHQMIWMVNRIKIQANTRDLSSKDNFIVGCLKRLYSLSSTFPEIEGAYKGLTRGLQGRNKNKNKSKNSSLQNNIGEESEKGESKAVSRTMTKDELKGKHPLYDMVLDCADLRNSFPYESFVELRHKWPDQDTDWPALIEWITQAHLSATPGNGIDNAYMVIASMLTRNKFQKKVAAGHSATPELAQHAREVGRLNNLYENGKMSDAEVRKAHAENDAKYGVKA